MPVFEGDHSFTSKVFHPTLELKQLLSTRQGSGADQNQLFLKLERWLFLYFLYTYLVYLVPRKEVVCALDGTDIYLVKKYGEFFWQLFCNFYIFNEVSQISGPAALPSKFVFCVLTVAVSYIRSFYRISDHELVHGESVLPSNKKEPKLFSTEDAWKSSDRSIIEFLHICSTLWSESLMSVDFMYLVCCIFVMVTPWMPLERWLNFPSSGGAVSWSTGSNGSSIQTLTKTTLGVPRMQGLKETSNAVQDTFPLDWNEFICHYKDLYGALIPFIVRKAAILGVFKNSQFISLLKMLSNSFHCRSFEQEDSLLIIMRNAYDHITESYDQSLYSLSKANEFCPFSFFHQGVDCN